MKQACIVAVDNISTHASRHSETNIVQEEPFHQPLQDDSNVKNQPTVADSPTAVKYANFFPTTSSTKVVTSTAKYFTRPESHAGDSDRSWSFAPPIKQDPVNNRPSAKAMPIYPFPASNHHQAAHRSGQVVVQQQPTSAIPNDVHQAETEPATSESSADETTNFIATEEENTKEPDISEEEDRRFPCEPGTVEILQQAQTPDPASYNKNNDQRPSSVVCSATKNVSSTSEESIVSNAPQSPTHVQEGTLISSGAPSARPTTPELQIAVQAKARHGCGVSLGSSPLITVPRAMQPRVTKSQGQTRSPPLCGKPTKAPQSKAISSSNRPSDEDLLYVLMYRIQETQSQRTAAVSKQQELEKINRRLQTANDEVRIQVSVANQSHAQARERYETLANELELFKCKFSKIKNWAKEINVDHIALRQRSDAFHQAVIELKTDNEALSSDVSTTKLSLVDASNMIQAHKKELVQVGSFLNQSSHVLEMVSQRHSQAQERLLEEKKRNRKFESHIFNLELTQQTHDKTVSRQNDLIRKELLQLSQKVNQVVLDSENSPDIAGALKESLSSILTPHGQQLKSSDLNDVAVAVQGLKKSFADNAAILNHSLHEINSSVVDAHAAQRLNDIRGAISRFEPLLTEIPNLQKHQANFEAKIQQNEETIGVLRESIEKSDAYAASFRQGNETLLEFVKSTNQADSKRQTDLEDTSNQLRLQWTNACSELEGVKSKIREQDEIRERLSSEIDKAQRQVYETKAQLQANETKTASLEMQKLLVVQQLDEANTKIEQQKLDLVNLQETIVLNGNSHSKYISEIEVLKSSQLESDHDKQLVVAEIRQLKTAHEQSQLRVEELQKQLETAKTEVEQLLGTITQFQQVQQESVIFRAQHSDCDQVPNNAATKDREITSLRAQLDHFQSTTNQQITTLTSQAQSAERDRCDLEEQLKVLKARAVEVVVLNDQLLEKDSTISELQVELSSFKATRSKCEILTKENFDLLQKFKDTEQGLQEIHGKLKELEQLQTSSSLKDQEILELKRQVNSNQLLSKEVTQMTETLRIKNEELQNRDVQVKDLQARLEVAIQEKPPHDASQSADMISQDTYEVMIQMAQAGTPAHIHSNQSSQGNAADTTAYAPLRKAADRSKPAAGKSRFLDSTVHSDEIPAMSTILISRSSTNARHESNNISKASAGLQEFSQVQNSPDCIPDSQTAYRKGVTNNTGDNRDDDNGETSDNTTSPLSNLSYLFESDDDLESQHAVLGELEAPIPEHRDRPKSGQESQDLSSTANTDRPCSQALSDDLLTQIVPRPGLNFTTNVATSSLQDNRTTVTQDITQRNAPNKHGSPTMRINGSQEESQGLSSTHHASRLPRNSSYRKRRSLTPFSELTVEPEVDPSITPPGRDRHQPNSAAKRSAEHEPATENGTGSKRLKRNPENLNVRSATSQATASLTRAVPVSSTISQMSVLGTHALTPGKTHRNPKPSRKTSKKSKYEKRFSEDS